MIVSAVLRARIKSCLGFVARAAGMSGIAVAMAACNREPSHANADAALEALLVSQRVTAGRLAVTTPWRRCTEHANTLLVVAACGTERANTDAFGSELVAAAARAGVIGRDDSTALWLRGLLALHDALTQPHAGSRAALLLQRAVATSSGAADKWNALAVAYMRQAEQEQRLTPLLDGLESVERALSASPRFRPALFTKAVVLERLSLRGASLRAWDAVLAVEPEGGWAEEARQRRATLAAGSAKAIVNMTTISGRGGASTVRPELARDSLFVVLGRWGEAVLEHDSAGSEVELRSARLVAMSSDRPDPTLTRMLTLVERSATAPTLRVALAHGHVALAHGFRAQAVASYDDAGASLRSATTHLSRAGSPGAQWSRIYDAICAVFQGDFVRSSALLDTAAATIDPVATPALAGKLAWAAGLSWVRRGAYERADSLYREAGPLFQAAGEYENAGAVSYLRADGLLLNGRHAEAGDEVLHGLRQLAGHRDSPYLGLLLMKLCIAALAARAPLAALAIAGESLDVVRDTHRPHLVAFAQLYTADALLALDRRTEARPYLDSARLHVALMRPGDGRDRLAAEIAVRQARTDLDALPERADIPIRTAVHTFRRLGVDGQLAQSLHLAARVALARRDSTAADAALREAAAVVERQGTTFGQTAGAYFAETVEQVYDDIARLALARRQTNLAFQAIERGRLARWTSSAVRGGAPVPSPADIARRLDGSTLVLAYAVLSDRLVLWAITRDTTSTHTALLTRGAIARMIADTGPDTWGSGAAVALERILLESAQDEIDRARHLIVIPDRELASVPFAALRNPRSRRYLVEDHELRWLASATQLRARPPAGLSQGRERGALLLTSAARGNVAADVPLPALPGAAREGARVASVYAERHWRVIGAEHRHDVLARLAEATVFHFAGHAIENIDRAERSLLALSDSAGRRTTIEAYDLGRLRLRHLRLVVLSACRTLNTRASRAGPVTGLAYSFLRAGAGGVVSTLWDIDDEPSASVLIDFHAQQVRGTSPTASLRIAQLRALSSQDSRARSPRTWAAFIYTGQ